MFFDITKNCWFPVKKCWCQQNSRAVSRDLYVFWIFFTSGIAVSSFIIVGYVWQILGICPPPSVSTPKRSILNRVRNFMQLFLPSVYKDPFQANMCDSAHFLCFSITSNVTIPCSVAFYLLSWVKALVSPLCLKHLIFLKTFDWVKEIFIFNWSTQKYIKAKSPFLLVV